MTALALSLSATPPRPTIGLSRPPLEGIAEPFAFQTMLAAQAPEVMSAPPIASLTPLVSPEPDYATKLGSLCMPPLQQMIEAAPLPLTGADALPPAAVVAAASASPVAAMPVIPARGFYIGDLEKKPRAASEDAPGVPKEETAADDSPVDLQSLIPATFVAAPPLAVPPTAVPLQDSAASAVPGAPVAVGKSGHGQIEQVDVAKPTSSEPAPALAVPSAVARDLAQFAVLTTTPATVAAIVRQLDLARGDAWLDDLARDIAGVAVRGGQLRFALAPETLGRLDVEVRHGDAGVNIHMAARSEAARDALALAQPRLVDEIRAQGVRVNGAEIAADTSGSGDDRAEQSPRQPHPPMVEARSIELPADRPAPRKSPAPGRYA